MPVTLKNLIHDAIPPLKVTDTGTRALKWMEEFRVRHLPVVNEQNYLGLISDNDILNVQVKGEMLSSMPLMLVRPYLFDSQNIYDALKFISTYKYTIIPIIDEHQNYTGSLTYRELLEAIAGMKEVRTPGGIVVLEFPVNDFSFSQVAQVMESNDAMILSSSVGPAPDNRFLELTLKLNVTDLTRIESAFFRYNYKVLAVYHHSEFSDDLQTRYHSLMNYLNM